jgi:putative SOS response-associated peptidase YedK
MYLKHELHTAMPGRHPRPVTLSPELAREWLDPATPKERAEQMVMNQGEPAEAFEWFKVNPVVGSVRNQGPDLIRAA